jgi:hypothetical protein
VSSVLYRDRESLRQRGFTSFCLLYKPVLAVVRINACALNGPPAAAVFSLVVV